MRNITLEARPELLRPFVQEETREDVLLRWLNFHLSRAGSDRAAKNFGQDLHDSVILTIALNRIAPQSCTLDRLKEDNLPNGARLMLRETDKIGCRKFAARRGSCREVRSSIWFA
jgi:hypothetical protein